MLVRSKSNTRDTNLRIDWYIARLGRRLSLWRRSARNLSGTAHALPIHRGVSPLQFTLTRSSQAVGLKLAVRLRTRHRDTASSVPCHRRLSCWSCDLEDIKSLLPQNVKHVHVLFGIVSVRKADSGPIVPPGMTEVCLRCGSGRAASSAVRISSELRHPDVVTFDV